MSAATGEARPKTIQQRRGMTPPPDDRTRPYSAESYAAQYGITVEDGAELREAFGTHGEIERAIFGMYRRSPDLRDRAVFAGEHDPTLTGRQRRKLELGGMDVEGMTRAGKAPLGAGR